MLKWAAGFTLRFGRPAVFIETPDLIAKKSERSLVGKALNELETDPAKKFQRCLVHELTHAFSANLRLPLWLNEGIAMVTVDRFCGTQTVRCRSLETLKGRTGRCKYGYRQMHKASIDELVYLYSRGYWVTKYLLETRPELLPPLLKKRRSARSLERRIARTLGLTWRQFWRVINEKALEHFASKLEGQGAKES